MKGYLPSVLSIMCWCVPISPGVSVARAYRVDDVLARHNPAILDAAALSAEVTRFKDAAAAVAKELDATVERASRTHTRGWFIYHACWSTTSTTEARSPRSWGPTGWRHSTCYPDGSITSDKVSYVCTSHESGMATHGAAR